MFTGEIADAVLNSSDSDASGKTTSIVQRVQDALQVHAGSKGPSALPFVTLTYAQSLDGSIASDPGETLMLSNALSRKLTHHLRALHDTILVGVNTVLADDPLLTVRYANGESPRPVIVDSSLRIPVHARILQERSDCRPIIATTDAASQDKETSLRANGAEVLRFEQDASGRVNLQALFAFLASRGVRSLMVEGGAKIITEVLNRKLAQQLVLTICPLFIGGYRAVSPSGQVKLDPVPRLRNVVCECMAGDMVLCGDFE